MTCLGVQYVGYERVLAAGLSRPEADARGQAIKRWLYFALTWQSLVLAGILVYAYVMTHGHRSGLAWVAPAVAALIGTALPYQLAAMRLVRAAAGG